MEPNTNKPSSTFVCQLLVIIRASSNVPNNSPVDFVNLTLKKFLLGTEERKTHPADICGLLIRNFASCDSRLVKSLKEGFIY